MAERVVHFSPGEEVEVGNSEKGFKGSWYVARVVREIDRPPRSASKTTKKKVFVEYQTLMADRKGGKPLRESVNLSRLRPKRPPLPPQEDEEADRSYQVDEKVEAFDHDGWWEGIVTKVLEGQRYRVCFNECDEEFEYHKSLLRRHFEWVDGRWVCEEAVAHDQQQTMEQMFTKGDSVEVRVDSEICGDTWFPAIVLKQTSNKRFLVELQTSHNNSFQLVETVDSQHIRPLPPQTAHVNAFQLSEKVDALYDWRWWSGVINRVLSGGRYVVFFKNQNKLKEFVHSDLRFHMDWVDGKWFRDSKEISEKPHDQDQNKSPGHVQSGQAGNTDPNIVLNSQLSLDADEVKAPFSLRACPVRGMSMGSPAVNENFLAHCSKDQYPEPLNSGQDKRKHDLESNEPRNLHSVEGCSSHLPYIIDIEENQVVDSPKLQTLARQMKLEVQTPRQKRKPLGGDDIEQQEMEGVSKQKMNAFDRRGQTREKVLGTEATVKGVSFDNQPTASSVRATTWKDSPVRGPELRNSINVDVSSFSFGGTTDNTLLDQAIGDEMSERIQQSSLICSSADQMLQEDESFPFIKCSPVWETVESLEVFRVMPQRGLHFCPLEQFDMHLREGYAIGSMVNFANLVKEVGKAKLDDPPSILQKWSNALENFKAYGFNVEPIQARLETLRRIKDKQAKLNEELMEAEGQISMILAENVSIEAEHNKKVRELQECLNQLIKKRELTVLKKEVQDSSIAELKKTIDNTRGCIHCVTCDFRTLVDTPWCLGE